VVDLGLTATCNPMGADKWKDSYSPYLKDKAVIILPDNDIPGQRHARKVVDSLNGIAKSIKIVELSGLNDGEDALFVKVVVANFKIQLYSPVADHPINN
jgi:hypothetical protein